MPEGGAKVALFVIEFIFLLAFIFLGSRLGGLGIGLAGGFGVLVFCLCFQLEAGALPLEVIEIIMCVIAAIASLQTAGGMDWLISVAERLMRKRPKLITIVAPLVTFFMTVLAGTGHTAFSTLPVIAEVAKVAGVRPSRPLTVAVTASQIGICASPISAAVVAFSSMMEPRGVSYPALLGVLLPSCLISTILTAIIANFLGKNLVDDPIYAERWEKGLTKGGPTPTRFLKKLDLEDPTAVESAPMTPYNPSSTQVSVTRAGSQHSSVSSHSREHSDATHADTIRVNKATVEFTTRTSRDQSMKGSAAAADEQPMDIEPIKERPVYPKAIFGLPSEKLSVAIFGVAIIFIVIYAILISESVGLTTDPPISRTYAILTVMLTAGLVICITCNVDTPKVVQAPTFKSGMTAVICVLGVAWMGDTFVSNYLTDIERIAGDVIKSQGWLLAVILFVASCLLYSQGVTTNALYPAALQMGVSNLVAVASYPAVSALFVLPTYPTLLAAVEMDDTGSTKIGKYIFDHSFIVPGIIHVVLSVLISFLFGLMILH